MIMNRFTGSAAAQEALSLIRGATRCYITAHVVPDGDAVGSALGLYWALAQMGKTVRVALPSGSEHAACRTVLSAVTERMGLTGRIRPDSPEGVSFTIGDAPALPKKMIDDE